MVMYPYAPIGDAVEGSPVPALHAGPAPAGQAAPGPAPAGFVAARILFLASMLSGLAAERYVLLKYFLSGIQDLSEESDLDMLVDGAASDRVHTFLRRDPSIDRFRWIDRGNMSVVRVFFKDGGYLQIDLLRAFSRKGVLYLDARRVLDSARINQEGWKVPGIVESFEYPFLFYVLNHADLPQRYRDRFTALPSEEISKILTHVAVQYGIRTERIEDLYAPNGEARRNLRRAILRRPENRFPGRMIRAVSWVMDALSPGRRAPVVSVSGPDGTGKTTLLDHVERRLSGMFRMPVARLRHRPGLLPILSAWRFGREEAERRAADRPPRSGRNHSFVSSLFRFLYYLLDYWVGQLFVHLRYTARGIIVLYDRYFFDFIADPERSNIRIPRSWVRFFCATIVEPDLNILLSAAPEEVCRRKKELGREAIRELNQRYARLFAELGGRRVGSRYLTLENASREAAVDEVLKAIVREL